MFLFSRWLFLFTVIFTSKIIRPIKKLVDAVREAGEGNLNARVEIKGNDEIAQLSKEFNYMIEQLRKAKDQLEEEKKVLEIRVRARTKELEELAQSLDEKVKERTKELQERLEELEKFHRLTVGREMKMAELKEKIQALERELQECKKQANKSQKLNKQKNGRKNNKKRG